MIERAEKEDLSDEVAASVKALVDQADATARAIMAAQELALLRALGLGPWWMFAPRPLREIMAQRCHLVVVTETTTGKSYAARKSSPEWPLFPIPSFVEWWA